MSIAVTAPQKFDFQDIVCVEMMLRFAHVGDARFLVEPDGDEDGELQFTAGPRAEIQVKGAAGAVTLATIATLAHTRPRIETNTLLQRLLADPERLVVLVMSGRCNDSAAPYAVRSDWAGAPHAANNITEANAKALLDAFAVAELPGVGGGKLKSNR